MDNGSYAADGVRILNGSEVVLYQVSLDSNADEGLDCEDSHVELYQSSVRINGGGLELQNASFIIKNNFIVQNDGNIGGIHLNNSEGQTVQDLYFNTIADNVSNSTSSPGSGPHCAAAKTAVLAIGNIYWGEDSPMFSGAGDCSHQYSNIKDMTGLVDGNISMLPGFKLQAGDYHLDPGGPGQDIEGLDSTDIGVMLDFDGDRRPSGTGPDMGADET